LRGFEPRELREPRRWQLQTGIDEGSPSSISFTDKLGRASGVGSITPLCALRTRSPGRRAAVRGRRALVVDARSPGWGTRDTVFGPARV